MKHARNATRIPCLLLSALLGIASLPNPSLAADVDQAEREARRIENEMRRQDAQARREIEGRARDQAEALRGQEESIRRTEALQSRMNADAERRAEQTAEQLRSNSYPYYTYSTPRRESAQGAAGAPAAPIMPSAVHDAVSKINFAPLSERLKSYFGTQSGVLVVSAGGGALGLQDGDVIISIDGRVPADGPHASRILESYRSGERVKLRVQRDRKAMDLDTIAP